MCFTITGMIQIEKIEKISLYSYDAKKHEGCKGNTKMPWTFNSAYENLISNTPHMLNESKIHEQVVTNTTNIK